MTRANERTVSVEVLAVNGSGIQVDTEEGPQWWNFSKYMPKNSPLASIKRGAELYVVVEPTQDGRGMWINRIGDSVAPNLQNTPAERGNGRTRQVESAPPPVLEDRPEAPAWIDEDGIDYRPRPASISAHDLLMARMSALKSATALATADPKKVRASAEVLEVARLFASWVVSGDSPDSPPS